MCVALGKYGGREGGVYLVGSAFPVFTRVIPFPATAAVALFSGNFHSDLHSGTRWKELKGQDPVVRETRPQNSDTHLMPVILVKELSAHRTPVDCRSVQNVQQTFAAISSFADAAAAANVWHGDGAEIVLRKRVSG